MPPWTHRNLSRPPIISTHIVEVEYPKTCSCPTVYLQKCCAPLSSPNYFVPPSISTRPIPYLLTTPCNSLSFSFILQYPSLTVLFFSLYKLRLFTINILLCANGKAGNVSARLLIFKAIHIETEIYEKKSYYSSWCTNISFYFNFIL